MYFEKCPKTHLVSGAAHLLPEIWQVIAQGYNG